jgi:hypothetical protein
MMTHGVGTSKETFNKTSAEAVSPKQVKSTVPAKVVSISLKQNEPKVNPLITLAH